MNEPEEYRRHRVVVSRDDPNSETIWVKIVCRRWHDDDDVGSQQQQQYLFGGKR